MIEPIISERAQRDLDEIWDYIACENPTAADRLLDRFLDTSRTFARFPEAGRPRDKLATGLRSFLVAPYVAFHRRNGDTIEIVRVVHGRRDIDRIMRGAQE